MAEYSFKSDPRISDYDRSKLRDFCASLEREIVTLVQDFGLAVFKEEMYPYQRGNLENAPSYRTPSGWIININQADRVETQNFTVAHELGHFVLHKQHLVGRNTFDGVVRRDAQGGLDPFTYIEAEDKMLEKEANRFAALLLMPSNLFRPAFERLDGDRTAVAKLFLVSEQAVGLRARELGLSR